MIYLIDDKDVKKRLDIFLSENLNEISRSYIKTLIESDNVKVNDKKQKAGYKLKVNDKVEINVPQPELIDNVAQNIPLDIVYEDDDIIIVNKPKGMVVHPANGNYTGTMVNALLYTHKENLSSINGKIRPGIVHRIDKDTSGILVVAKNDNAHKKLSEQFKVHSIKREYIALVKGIIAEDNFTINLPIGRSSNDRKKMAVTLKNSRSAITHIEVLERFYNSNMTLVKAILDTGRTHQIRVHMAYIGHPLVGDEVYSKNDKKTGLNIHGQMLHARTLGFIHPRTNKYIEFTSNIPKEFSDILEKLRKKERDSK